MFFSIEFFGVFNIKKSQFQFHLWLWG